MLRFPIGFISLYVNVASVIFTVVSAFVQLDYMQCKMPYILSLESGNFGTFLIIGVFIKTHECFTIHIWYAVE